MGWGLRSGISYCEIGNQFVFLDTRADRYFELEPATDAAFRTLLSHPSLPADDPALRHLQLHQLIVETPENVIAPCAHPAATGSLLDEQLPLPSSLSRLMAMGMFTVARGRFLWRGLHAELQAFSRIAHHTMPNRQIPLSLVAAYHAADGLIRSHDRCLPHSLALARALVRRGIRVEVVIGVRLRPFAAHCWIQRGPVLVNDRIDPVATYTPILAL